MKARPPRPARSAPALHRWFAHLALEAWLAGLQPTDGYNWPALAVCETGDDDRMHGSVYSTEYGILNEAVRENASPEVAARILDGRGTAAEQLAVAVAIERRFTIRSWGCWRAAMS